MQLISKCLWQDAPISPIVTHLPQRYTKRFARKMTEIVAEKKNRGFEDFKDSLMRSLICTHIENVRHSRMYQSWSPVLGPANDKGDVDRSTIVPFVFRLRWLLRLSDSLQTYRVNSWLYKRIFTVNNCLNAGTVDPRHNVTPRDQQIFLVISGYRWTSRRGNSSVFINSATRLMTEMLGLSHVSYISSLLQ